MCDQLTWQLDVSPWPLSTSRLHAWVEVEGTDPLVEVKGTDTLLPSRSTSLSVPTAWSPPSVPGLSVPTAWSPPSVPGLSDVIVCWSSWCRMWLGDIPTVSFCCETDGLVDVFVVCKSETCFMIKHIRPIKVLNHTFPNILVVTNWLKGDYHPRYQGW